MTSLDESIFLREIPDLATLRSMRAPYDAIRQRLVAMAQDGVFVCDTDDWPEPLVTGDYVKAIHSWVVSSDGRMIGIQIVASDTYKDSWDDVYSKVVTPDDWYSCPVDWLWLPREQYLPLAEKRMAQIRERRRLEAEEEARDKRRQRYLAIKDEFKELHKEFGEEDL